MSRTPGYAGWKFVEMNDEEKADVTLIAQIVDAAIAESGYDPSVRNTLTVTFQKAVLTIDKDEAFSGAFHQLADGKPFYRMEIAAGNKTLFDAQHDQSAALVFYMMQALGSGSMSVGGPMVLEHDFRGAILDKGLTIASYISQLKPYVVKDAPKGPKPN